MASRHGWPLNIGHRARPFVAATAAAHVARALVEAVRFPDT